MASADYLADYPPITTPQQLSTHQCLGYKNFDRYIWHLHSGDEFQSVDVKCNLSANEATTLLHAAIAGGGISVQPTYLTNQYLLNGRLQRVLAPWTLNPIKIYVLYPSRQHISTTVSALIDTLSEEFKNPAW